jgi:hypothetical protein
LRKMEMLSEWIPRIVLHRSRRVGRMAGGEFLRRIPEGDSGDHWTIIIATCWRGAED